MILIISGCNVQKFLPAEQYLYRGSSVEIIGPEGVNTTALQAELSGVVSNSTNQKTPVLGYTKVHKHYKFEQKKAKNPEKYGDEKKGEAPIFYTDDLVESVDNLLENRAAAAGFFGAEANYTLDTNQQAQEISVSYTVDVSRPYYFDTVHYYIPDTALARHIQELSDNTLLQAGERYDLDALKSERVRIQEALRERGYYYFRADDLEYFADSLGNDKGVVLLMKLKKDVEARHITPQRISTVDVYPNLEDRDSLERLRLDTISYQGLTIHCNDCPLRPDILDEAIALRPGERYNQQEHRRTLSRLSSYNMFRYVAMDYEPVGDSLLHLRVFTKPLLRRKIEGELGLSYNNARYFGPEIALGYTNRNLFRGAELLRLQGDFTYALFLGGEDEARIPRSLIYGVSGSLNIPRLFLPGGKERALDLMSSGTIIEAGLRVEGLRLNLNRFSQEIQEQELGQLANLLATDSSATENVNLQQFSTQFGYTWQKVTTKTHRLFPFSFRFQNPVVSEEELLALSRNLGLTEAGQAQSLSRFDRMLLWSPNYTLTKDTRIDGVDGHNIFWQQYMSFNVNRVTPVSSMGGESELSLYPQLETDFRYYRIFNDRQTLALRLHGGIAYALSERAIVPYFDQYTIGGPNSLRGFIPRQLGPGRTIPVDNNLLSFGGYGNIILESSLEFRQKLDPLIEVAAFVDAGNVWTYKTELAELTSDFRTATFIDELAMDAGIGLRLDFEFLILRIDLAKPFRVPYEQAVAELPDPSVAEVDKSLKFVLAFGHPF